MDHYRAFVGLDVHKETISVAVAEADRDGEVRHLGAIPNRPEAVAKLARRTVDRHGLVEFAYEAGPRGYGIYRQLTGLGLPCRVIAPSTIPRRPGDRIKNDTRDAVSLARLLRAGELRFVWVPDEVHEAMRDLVRARQVAANELRTAKARIQMFLLKHGRLYARKPWATGTVSGWQIRVSTIPPSRLRCNATSTLWSRPRPGRRISRSRSVSWSNTGHWARS